MTSTETAPRKRAPRKAAAPAGDDVDPKAGVVDSRKAQQIREQIEAETGELVTAAAARRTRGGVTGYKVTRPAGEPTPNGRAAVGHSDDPGPVEPGIEEDPDAGDPGLTDPPAPKPVPSPAAPPAELPAGVIACGPGELTPGDAATLAEFGEQLEARAAAADAALRAAGPIGEAFADVMVEQLAEDAADRALALDVDDFDHGDQPADVEAFDPRDLVAVELIPTTDVEAFDPRVLVAGRIETAPDGRRVTVWDRAASIVEVMNAAAQIRTGAPVFDAASHAAVREAYDATHDVDTAAGEVVNLDEGGDPTRVKLSAELAAAIEEARGLEARAGELKEAAEAIRAQVRDALGGDDGRGEVALDPQGRELARWTRVTSTKCSTTALKKADPDTWAKYATTTVSRRFTWAD